MILKKKSIEPVTWNHPNGCAYEDRKAKILHKKQNRNRTDCIPNRIF